MQVQMNFTGNSTNLTDSNTDASTSGPTFSLHITILLGVILGLVDIVTFLGNLIVILSFVVEPKLRSTFNIYIINLAVTDIFVALTAMSFYTIDTLLGRWPFGEFLCGVWIFFDYGMTFASVFTLVAISVDRFWSVYRSIHYRNNNTKKKCVITLAIVWMAVMAVWLVPCIVDRVRWSQPNVCKWEPSNNPEFVVFVAIVGHHLPCLLLIFCYVRVFLFMRSKRMRVTVQERNEKPAVRASNSGATDEDTRVTTSTTVTTVSAKVDGKHGKTPAPQQTTAKTMRGEKEKRIFVTLSYIIISYLICWVPFHFVFDLSAINPALVPETIYTITFWMTYINSTLNPFLYAFGSVDFRKAFKRVIFCQYRQSATADFHDKRSGHQSGHSVD